MNEWLRVFDFDAGTGKPVATGRGLAVVTLTNTGAFSCRLNFDGGSFRVKGTLDAFGKAHFRLARSGAEALQVELSRNVDEPASALDIAVVADAFCALGSASALAVPLVATRLGVTLDPVAGSAATPNLGTGYASLVRARSGAWRGIGALRDGVKISFGGWIVRDHLDGVAALPIYLRLSDGGVLSGLPGFQDEASPANVVTGTLQRLAPLAAPQAPRAVREPVAKNRAFVSTDGNDANDGTRAAPFGTLQAALAKIGGEGEIVMLAGDYEGAKLDLETARRLTIRSESGRGVRIFLGEKVPGSAFSPHAGNVWKAPVRSVVPAQGSENRWWVFEMGTPESLIPAAARRPQQRGRTHRLDHFRLVQAVSIDSVNDGSGRYFISDGMLYIRTSKGGPPAPDQEFRIPSQLVNESFVFNAKPQSEITLQGIEILCGHEDADLSGAGSYRVSGCKFFGAGNSGILAINVPRGIEERCEYAANANDGCAPVNYGVEPARITVIDPWSHDNGDEGHSVHVNCSGCYFGGLFENNANGGITPAIGASAVILGARTRGNVAGLSPAVEPGVNLLAADWISEGDFDGIEQSTGGLATVVDSSIVPARFGFAAITANARIDVFNKAIRGGFNEVGGAVANIRFVTGSVGAGWSRDPGAALFDVRGSLYRMPPGSARIAPFGSGTPNAHIEILQMNAQGSAVSVLSQDFTVARGNVIAITGANPQMLRMAVDPQSGVFRGDYRDAADSRVRHTFGGIIVQDRKIGVGVSDGAAAVGSVAISIR